MSIKENFKFAKNKSCKVGEKVTRFINEHQLAMFAGVAIIGWLIGNNSNNIDRKTSYRNGHADGFNRGVDYALDTMERVAPEANASSVVRREYLKDISSFKKAVK